MVDVQHSKLDSSCVTRELATPKIASVQDPINHCIASLCTSCLTKVKKKKKSKTFFVMFSFDNLPSLSCTFVAVKIALFKTKGS